MKDFRSLSTTWASKTYAMGLSELNLDKPLLEQATQLFKELNIYNLPMDGYSCEKLPKTEEQRVGINVTYSEIFHSEIEEEHFSPASYLVRLIKECNNSSISNTKYVGGLARGLRTLTSLLREPDFALQLESLLKEIDPDVVTSLNSKQDSSDHTDVLLTYQNQTYRIWLYQFSSRGLPHDIERLTGKRGELPDGIHLICPLHTELAIEYDKLQKRMERMQEKLQNYHLKLEECSERATKKRENIVSQIQKISLQIADLQISLDKEYSASISELDIVNGWFFYSNQHLNRIIDFLNTTSSPIDYEEVVRILTAAENFVGKIHSFKKGN